METVINMAQEHMDVTHQGQLLQLVEIVMTATLPLDLPLDPIHIMEVGERPIEVMEVLIGIVAEQPQPNMQLLFLMFHGDAHLLAHLQLPSQAGEHLPPHAALQEIGLRHALDSQMSHVISQLETLQVLVLEGHHVTPREVLYSKDAVSPR